MRIIKIVIGLGLIGYGFYSGNSWFFLGTPLIITGIINFCPFEGLMNKCKDETCNDSSCCSTSNKESVSCCNTNNKKETISCCNEDKKIVIKILGTGCANCIALKKVVDEAVSQLNEDIMVIKVEDLQEITSYNVISMPGFVINDKVISTGKILNLDEVKKYIKDEQKMI